MASSLAYRLAPGGTRSDDDGALRLCPVLERVPVRLHLHLAGRPANADSGAGRFYRDLDGRLGRADGSRVLGRATSDYRVPLSATLLDLWHCDRSDKGIAGFVAPNTAALSHALLGRTHDENRNHWRWRLRFSASADGGPAQFPRAARCDYRPDGHRRRPAGAHSRRRPRV